MESKNYAVFEEAVPELKEEPLLLKEDIRSIPDYSRSGDVRQVITELQKVLVDEATANIMKKLSEKGIDAASCKEIISREIYEALSVEQITMSLM